MERMWEAKAVRIVFRKISLLADEMFENFHDRILFMVLEIMDLK